MDSVLRLDQDMSVELQGWLLKRGAGYSDEADAEEQTRGLFQPLKGALFGKGDKSRYFILVKTERKLGTILQPSATLYYYNKQPEIVKEKAYGQVEAVNKRGTHQKMARMERKTEHGKGVNVIQRRGQVALSTESRIHLKDGVIKLINPGRTYYLRSPTNKQSQAEKSYTVGQWFEGLRKMITWLQNWKIRESTKLTINSSHLNRLSVAYQRQSMLFNQASITRKESIGFNNIEDHIPSSLTEILKEPFYRKEFKDYLGYAHATENLDFFDKVTEYQNQVERLLKVSKLKSANKDIESFAKSICAEFIAENAPRQVNLSSDQRKKVLSAVNNGGKVTSSTFNEAQHEIYLLMETNFFQRFYRDLLKRTGCFATLFHQCGIPGYESIVQNHFGSVMSESQRLLDMYQGKMEAVDRQITVLEKSLKFSFEVAVPELKTFRYALYASYSSSVKRLDALNIFKTELQEHGIDRLLTLTDTLKNELGEILESDGRKIAIWKATRERHEQAAAMERSLQMHVRMVQQDAESLERANEDLAKFKIKLVEGEFDEMLQEAKTGTEHLHLEERNAFKELSDELSDSLNNLEKLDLHRLGEQQAVMANILVAEGDLYTALALNLASSRSRIDRIKIGNDVERLTSAMSAELTNKVFSTTL